MNTLIIKKIVDNLPVAGDKVIEIKDGYAIYESNGKIKIESSSGLMVGDMVIGVYHGLDDNSVEPKIIISIDHKTGRTITDDSLSIEYLKIERRLKLNKILGNGND